MKLLRGICLLALANLCFAGSDSASAQNRWGRDYLPNSVVITHEAKPVRFYDDLIKNRLVLISFVYTSCPDICPLVTARLAELQDKLGDELGKSIHFVSVSIDPERDSPEVLAKYAAAFKTRPGWTFVTGRPDEIKQIRHKLGERSRRVFEHQNDVVLVNDATGEWARNSAFTEIDRLADALRMMDPKWRAQTRSVEPGHTAAIFLDANRPGEAMFARLCASCHTIGRGPKIGPDLAGVTERHEKEWLRRFIKSPDRLRVEKDPVALASAARYEGVRMPNLGLSDLDVQDVLTYIDARTYAARGTATGQTTPPAGHTHNH